ncbi:MAG: DUF4924 family protein [Flavobacteriales bacterium]|nr:DUF4924 family protein [Flavobacteriales bacterium]
MSLAAQKLKQNVAEYIIFLWQMEDLVRAMHFDTEALDEFVKSFTPDESSFQEERNWFIELANAMKREGVEQRGHIAEVHELIFELNYLHNTLANLVKDKTYLDLYRRAQPNIKEYLLRTDGKSTNDVEVCLTALYGMLILRLKKEPVSDETASAMQTFSNLMAKLAHHYKLMKQGEVNFSLN